MVTQVGEFLAQSQILAEGQLLISALIETCTALSSWHLIPLGNQGYQNQFALTMNSCPPLQSGVTGEMSIVIDRFGFGGPFTSTSNQSECGHFASSTNSL
jgi:hypothetical protein